MKFIVSLSFLLIFSAQLFSQYPPKQAEFSSVNISGESYSIVKLFNNNKRLRFKYFASKDQNGNSVHKRYLAWAMNKNVICYSSGTYMDDYDLKIAKPIGLCIDQGRVVNNGLILDKFEGLVIVYPSGRISVHNLKSKSIQIDNGEGQMMNFDLASGFSTLQFIKWAKEQEATVFQTHLFCFKNQLYENLDNKKKAGRRFMAAGKDVSGVFKHYIINLSSPNTLLEASRKATRYLKSYEDIIEVEYLINLDPGAQDVFGAYLPSGKKNNSKGFQGTLDIAKSLNLIVCYVE